MSANIIITKQEMQIIRCMWASAAVPSPSARTRHRHTRASSVRSQAGRRAGAGVRAVERRRTMWWWC